MSQKTKSKFEGQQYIRAKSAPPREHLLMDYDWHFAFGHPYAGAIMLRDHTWRVCLYGRALITMANLRHLAGPLFILITGCWMPADFQRMTFGI
jgi:hypothetical protein